MSQPVYIVDVFADAVAATSVALLTTLQAIDSTITAVRFEYGHRADVNERIIAYGNQGKNFCPMVILFEDYKIQRGEVGYTGITNLVIMIIYYSKAAITRVQREANVFRPILYPVYNELIHQLKIDGRFSIYDETLVKHNLVPRPHWGDPDLYKEYPLKDVFDGIEISNLQLKTFLNNCL